MSSSWHQYLHVVNTELCWLWMGFMIFLGGGLLNQHQSTSRLGLLFFPSRYDSLIISNVAAPWKSRPGGQNLAQVQSYTFSHQNHFCMEITSHFRDNGQISAPWTERRAWVWMSEWGHRYLRFISSCLLESLHDVFVVKLQKRFVDVMRLTG